VKSRVGIHSTCINCIIITGIKKYPLTGCKTESSQTIEKKQVPEFATRISEDLVTPASGTLGNQSGLSDKNLSTMKDIIPARAEEVRMSNQMMTKRCN
ncbi:hypothetical protein J0S82_000110, partial [Galemys pyrenaicus]